MKNNKNGNLMKLVAFFLICAVLTCTVAYASGSHIIQNNNGQAVDNQSSGNTDNNKDDTQVNNDEQDYITQSPKTYHYITGLEVENNSLPNIPIAITYDPNSPLYGISSCYLTVEIPIENGDTRIIGFTDNALSLGKIGGVSSTRQYFQNIIRYFGGISLYYGNDSDQNESLPLPQVNLKECLGYYYTEGDGNIYTTNDLVSALLIKKGIATVSATPHNVPYIHRESNAENLFFTDKAATIEIKFSDTNSTVLTYSADNHSYNILKSTPFIDNIDNTLPKYENVFILFSDSITYETEDYKEISLSTDTSGSGLYFTSGTYTSIKWNVDTDNNLIFTDSNNEKLVINRGESYITYVKSSEKSNIVII